MLGTNKVDMVEMIIFRQLFKITHLFAVMKGKKTPHVKEAFQQAQKPHQNHAKLVTSLKHTYNEVSLIVNMY